MRARNIKPGFFENEDLAELSFECRLLYIGLWCYADREGRFEWRPKRIKALIFPYDNVDINKLLNVITCNGHVMTYNYNEKEYGFIPTFLKHNRPHPHEAKSQCPPPPDDIKQQHRKMSLHVTDMSVKCTSDIMNDDIMNDDIMNDRKQKKIKIFDLDSIELKLATLLYNLIKKRNNGHKPPNLQKWAYDINLMIRCDKRNPEHIERVIRWCQADTDPNGKGFCWANNILSAKKLKEQYDQLYLKMNQVDIREKKNKEQERKMAEHKEKMKKLMKGYNESRGI